MEYISISEVTKYIKTKLETDPFLMNVYIKGEISNFKNHSSGHMYFSLKDDSSKINAIMFRSAASRLLFNPTDGAKVLVRGRIGVYEATGQYQIYVEEMVEDGLGNLYLKFEELKKKLLSEGLFAKEHKKKIPKIPKKIGVVTAPTGAVIRDIMTTIKRRYPLVEIILFPSLVQGDGAKESIVKQIKRASEYDVDTLIVGRGGGSLEDLWPFNEEDVARAIYECEIPVISAVGHEIDITISDYVADLRAPTPTAAAELAVPNVVDLLNYLDQVKIRSYEALNNKIKISQSRLDALKNSYVLKSPMRLYETKIQKLDNLRFSLIQNMMNKIKVSQSKLEALKNSYVLKNPLGLYETKIQKLDNLKQELIKVMVNKIEYNKNCVENLKSTLLALDPKGVLKRGYAIVRHNDTPLSGLESLNKGDMLEIELSKGLIKSEIKELEEVK